MSGAAVAGRAPGPDPVMNRPAAPTCPHDTRAWALAFAAWLVAAASTLGALFLGEVMREPTCVLCWYQRICMFPLTVILPLGLFPLERNVVRCARWLATIGLGIAGYHLLLIAGAIPQSAAPCEQGIPCSERGISWFGFVSVPLLAAAAFAAIVVLTWLAGRRSAPVPTPRMVRPRRAEPARERPFADS